MIFGELFRLEYIVCGFHFTLRVTRRQRERSGLGLSKTCIHQPKGLIIVSGLQHVIDSLLARARRFSCFRIEMQFNDQLFNQTNSLSAGCRRAHTMQFSYQTEFALIGKARISLLF